MEEQLRRDALEYHRVPTFGKISVTPTKSLVNQRDLALAYSPGVAYACLAIQDDPKEAATRTSRHAPRATQLPGRRRRRVWHMAAWLCPLSCKWR